MSGTPFTQTINCCNVSHEDVSAALDSTVKVEELALTLTRWMWILWPPLIIVLGTFGNVATVLVLSRLGSAGPSSINVYLLTLALSDLLVLYAGLLRYWILEVFQYDLYAWHSAVCKLGMWLYGAAWHNSTYLLVALTFQRALSVLWPHRVHIMCTHRTTWAVIGGIAVTSLLCLAHVPYGYDIVYDGNNSSGTCGHGSMAYHMFNAELWVYVEIVTFALLPFLCLAVSNGALAFRLTVSVSAATSSLTSARPTQQLQQRRKTASSTTITVMVVSFVFIVLNLPLFILLIVSSSHHLDAPEQSAEGFDAATAEESEISGVEYFVQAFVAILLFCNSAVNFYLYCLTGSRFRNEFKQLICGYSDLKPVSSRSGSSSGAESDDTTDDL